MRTEGASTPPPGHQLPERKHSALLHLKIREANKVWKAKPARQDAAPRPAGPAKGSQQESREIAVLERLWGWRTCDRCGGIVVLGEETFRVLHDGTTEEMCLGCAQELATELPSAPVLALPRPPAGLDPGVGVHAIPWSNQTRVGIREEERHE
jgi:hypothetical protein